MRELPGVTAAEVDPGRKLPGSSSFAARTAIRWRGVPLNGERLAVSKRDSIYGMPAEQPFEAPPCARRLLLQIATDQLPALASCAVPGEWTPQAAVFEIRSLFQPASSVLSIGGKQRSPGKPPVQLPRLVTDAEPVVVLEAEETP